ncbi:MAG: type II toxin-antitoxin system CcdA family antitoxin [Inquilinus limosus]|uniref:Type II toxin-antitoxin system CcdA family antitoxin n=1 Tax=Inquilinus limosus TaxID=171674 RepID=A0A952FPI9_9PROT|nr:type II toxin-antitoxin system CcdA family antitoxin [Inquilinus limosus]
MPDQDEPKDYDPMEAADETKRRDEAARWKEENAEAIRSYNEWVAEEGLPFAKFRQF